MTLVGLSTKSVSSVFVPNSRILAASAMWTHIPHGLVSKIGIN